MSEKKKDLRKYVLVQSTEEEKEAYRKAAKFDGLDFVSAWFKQLAHKRMKRIEIEKKNE